MRATPRESGSRILRLIALVLSYWATLIVLSFPDPQLPHAVLPIAVFAGLPLLLYAGFGLWRQARQGMAGLAFIDDLTGLGNVRAFDHEAEVLLRSAKPGSLALLLLDADRLKAVNDACGHQAGDELLRITANHLKLAAAPHTVFRIGGDEFAVLVDRSSGSSIISLVSQLPPLTAQFAACGHEHEIHTSFGFASNTPAETPETLFRRADERLRDVKRRQYESGLLPDRRAGPRAEAPGPAAAPVDPDNIASLEAHRRSQRGRSSF